MGRERKGGPGPVLKPIGPRLSWPCFFERVVASILPVLMTLSCDEINNRNITFRRHKFAQKRLHPLLRSYYNTIAKPVPENVAS